ncbi:MAG: restriction endonuclease subunit S [Gammaproteobacteria bacterium]
MTVSWPVKRLAEVCEFQRGLTYKKTDEVDSSDNVVLRANNIDLLTGLLDLSDLRCIDDRVDVPTTKQVKAGCLLVCTASGSKSHLGKVAYIDVDYGYAFGGFMGQICPIDELLPKFLYYRMISEDYREFIQNLSDGANINNLKFDNLGEFHVPVPDLKEQKRIVAILDEAFEGIATAKANAEKNLENAKAIFEGYLDSTMVGLCQGGLMKPLGDLCKTAAGGTPLKSKKEYYEGGSIPWILSGEVAQGEITKAEKFITQAGLDGSSAKLFPPNSVLVAMYGATAGQVGILRFEAATNQAVCGIYPTEMYQPEFLFYFFLHSKRALVAQAVGNAQPNISQEKIRSTSIPVITVTEQLSVVERLRSARDEACELEDIYRQKLAALEGLKKSLLHHAFSGQL